MFSLNGLIQSTNSNIQPRIVRSSQLNIGSFPVTHPYFQRGGGSMFERVSIQRTKCLSCPNTR